MSKPTISARLSSETVERLKKIHQESPLRKAVEAYLSLRTQTLAEMKGRFTKNELACLVDIQYGVALEPLELVTKRRWLASIADADSLDGIAGKWEISLDDLIEKVKQLHPAEAFFWQEIIDIFWNNPKAYGSPAPDLGKFLDDWQ